MHTLRGFIIDLLPASYPIQAVFTRLIDALTVNLKKTNDAKAMTESSSGDVKPVGDNGRLGISPVRFRKPKFTNIQHIEAFEVGIIFNDHFIANLLLSVSVKEFEKC